MYSRPCSSSSGAFSVGFGFLWHGFPLALLAEQVSYDLQTFDFALYSLLLQFFFPQDLVYIFQRIFPSFVRFSCTPTQALVGDDLPLCAAWAHPVLRADSNVRVSKQLVLRLPLGEALAG